MCFNEIDFPPGCFDQEISCSKGCCKEVEWDVETVYAGAVSLGSNAAEVIPDADQPPGSKVYGTLHINTAVRSKLQIGLKCGRTIIANLQP